MKPHGFAYPWAMYLLALLPVLGVFGLWAWRQRRLALARAELDLADRFDVLLVNDDVKRAAERLLTLLLDG